MANDLILEDTMKDLQLSKSCEIYKFWRESYILHYIQKSAKKDL